MFLRPSSRYLTVKSLVYLFFAFVSVANAANGQNHEYWPGKFYSTFCRQYGLGTEAGSGMAMYRHQIDGREVLIHLADRTRILSIGVRDNEGKLDRSLESVNAVVPCLAPKLWDGNDEQLVGDLPQWLGGSHLRFEFKYGHGDRFISEFLVYHHIVGDVQLLVYVDKQDLITRIEYLRSPEHKWELIGISKGVQDQQSRKVQKYPSPKVPESE